MRAGFFSGYCIGAVVDFQACTQQAIRGGGKRMNQDVRDVEEFQIGDRVAYIGFHVPEYGTITGVTVAVPKDAEDALEIRVYIIEMDDGGIFSGLSRHLRRAKTP